MVLRMPRPWSNPETGMFYYRARIPTDISKNVLGESLTVVVADGVVSKIKLGTGPVKVSLHTKDAGVAKVRHASVEAALRKRWEAVRQGPVELTHKQVLALAGEWYRALVSSHEDEPGSEVGWDAYRDVLINGLQYLDPDSDGSDAPAYDPDRGHRLLARVIDVDAFLSERGLVVAEASRLALLHEMALAHLDGASTLIRRAGGDYGRDRVADRFPAFTSTKPAATTASAVPFKTLIDGWAKEKEPKAATVQLYTTYITRFGEFVGHDDASRVTRKDVVAWKQHLLDAGDAPATINGAKLAALKAVFAWSVENELLVENPANRVSVVRKAKLDERMKAFTPDEAQAILTAAVREKSPVRRWVPLLCAQSGARVAEVCQLRKEDLREQKGIWFMRFTAEAGSLKNANSQRDVPLHPKVIEAGFMEFVKGKSDGPLFYDPKRRQKDSTKPSAKIVSKNLANWVHTLGLEVGRVHRKDPNHAWRHYFKTVARAHGVQDSVSDRITGHAAANEGQNYGGLWLETLYEAIAKLPLPGMSGEKL